jgi:hypothetical protein
MIEKSTVFYDNSFRIAGWGRFVFWLKSKESIGLR